MIVHAPSWAIAGQAIEGRADEPHLAKGVHLRVASHPALGLPVIPLRIRRIDLGPSGKHAPTRSDVVWRDADGTQLPASFTLGEGASATAHFPPGTTCCWAEVTARPVRPRPPRFRPPFRRGGVVFGGTVGRIPGVPGRRPPVVSPATTTISDAIGATGNFAPIAGARAGGARINIGDLAGIVDRPRTDEVTVDVDLTRIAARDLVPGLRIDPQVLAELFRPRGTSVQARVATEHGDATIATATSAPFQVWASHVHRVLVTGPLVVTGIRWIDATSVDDAEIWEDLDLPTPGGPRYHGFTDAEDRARSRVERGAARRVPLWDALDAPAPTAASLQDPGDVVQRTLELSDDGGRTHCLDRLVTDLAVPQAAQVVEEPILDERNGSTLGTSTRSCLDTWFSGTIDPDLARHSGSMDVDPEPLGEPGHVVAYVVEGAWLPDPDLMQETGLSAALPPGLLVSASHVLERDVPGPQDDSIGDRLPRLKKLASVLDGDYLVGRIVLCATRRMPFDPPPTPGLGPAEDGRSTPRTPPTSDWVATAVVPDARREVSLPLAGLAAGHTLAASATDAGGRRTLHRRSTDGHQLPLTAATPPRAIAPHLGVLHDRAAGRQSTTYRVAQADWFGRWSGWRDAAVGAGLSPQPPRAAVRATYRQPAGAELPQPPPGGPVRGMLRVEVDLPRPDAMAPGSHPLAGADVEVVEVAGTRVLTATAPALGGGPLPPALVLAIPGPAIAATRSTTVTLRARWHDDAGNVGEFGEPAQLVLHDPRPPQAVVLPPTLDYTSRPDATQRSRARLQWTASAGQRRFRVFASDETSVRAGLEDVASGGGADGVAATTVLTALDAAADPAARGAVLVANRATLRRDWFTQATAEPLDAPPSGPITFEHAVSGALRVLALYRVVAVSESNVESDFAGSPLVPFGVPNTTPPTTPSIRTMPLVDAASPSGFAVEVLVDVRQGVTPAARWRLRRSRTLADTHLMPIAATGTVSAPTENGTQGFTVIDRGGSELDPSARITPWSTWTHRVEVQGPALPGGGPEPEWSSASPPVSCTVIPPAGPAPATQVLAVRDGGGVRIEVSHPEPLAGGALGSYVVDVYRRTTSSMVHVGTKLGDDPARGHDPANPFVVIDDDAPSGTAWVAIVTDPVGRSSSASPEGVLA